ncbi:tetratricopeptide repeat protein [Psychroflexus aestuariivivens]|uniref:tetratricopeptide repeat protein n=1 Tax=Psychroflexus aestuariivivens TaxID=1795040 RepID=UPI000FD80428|nr:tetratricopeptide repeat protein [Psychroflexus aestuariivivens]
MKYQLIIILLIVHFISNAQSLSNKTLDSLYAVGEYKFIIDYFETNPPDNFRTQILLAKTYQSKKFYESAISTYNQALRNKNDSPKYQFIFAKLLKKKKQYKAADSLLRLLHKKYPNNSEFAYQLGLTKAKLNDISPDFYYSKALENDASHQPAAYALGEFYLKIKSYAKAEEVCTSALQYNPKNTKILGLLGQVYYRQRKLEKSIETFKRLEKQIKLPKFIIEKLAIAYANTNEFEKSITYYKRLLEIAPKDFKYHYQIARVYLANGDLELAKTHATLSISNKDTSLDTERFSLAMIFVAEQNDRNAIKCFEKVVEENPTNERAQYELAMAADRYFKKTKDKLPYFEAYEEKYQNLENSKYKSIIYRRLTDLRREMHFAKSDLQEDKP